MAIEYDNMAKDLPYFERRMYQQYAEFERAKLKCAKSLRSNTIV